MSEAVDKGCRYQLRKLLGEGGMGQVYLGEDEHLRRTVAVKCLLKEHLEDEALRGRFFDEARILAGLGHPGAIPVYEFGTMADGRQYYVMKQVRGETLKSMLDARDETTLTNPSSLLHFLDIFISVCRTMAAAHAEDIMHRDLKPENVMVDRFDAVYLMDWGLAKKIDREAGRNGRTQVGQIIGTPSYMSPEQARGAPLESDTQSDVFALGSVPYEILTGASPFHGETVQDSLKGVLYHDPEDPRKKNPIVAKALSAICMKALDKDPYRRYRSAAELTADLTRYREYLPVTAIKQSTLDRFKNWARRKPALAGAAGSLLATMLVVGLALTGEIVMQRVFVGGIYEVIEELRGEDQTFQAELKLRRAELAAAPSGTQRHQQLRFQVGQLKEKIEIREELVQGLAMGILTVAKLAREAPAQKVLRDVYRNRVNRHIEEDRYGAALALLNFTINTHGRRNPFHITREEVEELKQLRERVILKMDQFVEIRLRLEMVHEAEPNGRPDSVWPSTAGETMELTLPLNMPGCFCDAL